MVNFSTWLPWKLISEVDNEYHYLELRKYLNRSPLSSNMYAIFPTGFNILSDNHCGIIFVIFFRQNGYHGDQEIGNLTNQYSSTSSTTRALQLPDMKVLCTIVPLISMHLFENSSYGLAWPIAMTTHFTELLKE